MKQVSALLLVGLLAVRAPSQQPASAVPVPNPANRPVRHILQPPKSALAQGPAARSTAETMAAHTDPPLKQLPAFSVSGLDGKAADVSAVHPAGHWLLLYRSERCQGCDKVMVSLAKSESPLFKQGSPLVIVVKRNTAGSSTGMLDHIKGTYPTLANAKWEEDIGGQGLTALKPHGEPVLYALSGNDIAWAVHGTLNNPAILERQASTWLASTAKPQVVSSSASVKTTAVGTSAATAGKKAVAAH